MNEFQINCEKSLIEALRGKGFSIRERTVSKGDTYITGKVGEYQFWIYDDGSDFLSDFYGKVYEKYDYDNFEELIGRFSVDLIDALENVELYRSEYEEKMKKWQHRLFRWVGEKLRRKND